VEILKRLVPKATRVAIFHDSRPVATRVAAHYERAARSLALEPVMLSSMDNNELAREMRSLPSRKVQAAMVVWAPTDPEPFFREALSVRIPFIGVGEEDAERGALAAYFAADSGSIDRIVPIVEQVLRGSNPAAMPFQYPQNFRLVINKRSAEAIGLVVPPDLLVRADRVIE
jgi:putative ABC transport system substrate-binding protein